MVGTALDDKTHHKLVAGFGVRAKTHPERNQLIGTIDQAFIDGGGGLSSDFDFALWNCACPDQQTPFLTGNKWLTLSNLCKSDTIAASVTRGGNTQLKLYLPEVLAYLALESNDPKIVAT